MVTILVMFKKIPPLAKGLISIAILKTIGIWIFLSFSPAKKVKVTPDTMHHHLNQHVPIPYKNQPETTLPRNQKDTTL
jgi:hypothetical protein